MFKKTIGWAAVFLGVLGVALLLTGLFAYADKFSLERKLQSALLSSQPDKQLLELKDRSPDREIQGISLFDLGTIHLRGFLAKGEWLELEKSLIFLQNSVLVSPSGTEAARRAAVNLEIAKSLIKEKGLEKYLQKWLKEDSGDNQTTGQDASSDQAGISKKNQAPGGISETQGPLSNGEGYGRGLNPWDY